MLHRRRWAEIATSIRAASKALLVPYAILQLGMAASLPDGASAFLALSYILPWAMENRTALRHMQHTLTHRARPRLRTRPAAVAVHEEADHCSASRDQPLGPDAAIETSEALAHLLAAAPARVFLAAGDICAICLDALPQPAAALAASCRGSAAAQALRALEPTVVALRCGHALHVECAEAAVCVAAHRHVRCPLCREPVTLAGAASARMFN